MALLVTFEWHRRAFTQRQTHKESTASRTIVNRWKTATHVIFQNSRIATHWATLVRILENSWPPAAAEVHTRNRDFGFGPQRTVVAFVFWGMCTMEQPRTPVHHHIRMQHGTGMWSFNTSPGLAHQVQRAHQTSPTTDRFGRNSIQRIKQPLL